MNGSAFIEINLYFYIFRGNHCQAKEEDGARQSRRGVKKGEVAGVLLLLFPRLCVKAMMDSLSFLRKEVSL